MVKKMFISLAALSMAFFFTFSFSHAETLTAGKMYDAFNQKYSTDNYDYKNGSLKLIDAQTFNLSTPIKVKSGDKVTPISQVTAAVASYKTVRDTIFLKDWNDYAYYAPEAGIMLTEADVMNIKQIQDFENQHTASVSLELGPIILLLLLVFIIPLLFGYIWVKTQYNTLEFKIKNRLLE